MLLLFILSVILVLAVSLVLFLLNDGKLDKKTWVYAGVFAFVSLMTGAIMWLLYEMAQLPIFYIFVIGLVIFLIAGYFHLEKLYSLLWARRDADNWSKDSFLKEAGFTFSLASVMSLICLMCFGFLLKKWDVAASMWGFLLIFPLPFLLTKAYDFLRQIPEKDFDKKWFYEVFPFDETQWKRENMVSVGFQVADSLQNEGRWFSKKARFSIVIPRDQELRMIYRLALREYHKKNPSVPVQELGYEEEGPKFWWLFYVPFLLWKPRTWWRQNPYLDPNESIANNHLRNGDFIVAKRMMVE
ncbi:TssN family type VI secretion system protein [Sabulibacter ruber]|uniref:TssN family type VI secretion system protein n=1 Tax=Sabulibacter ruber TaxID=2811901 RepID=UPI001A959708|nr:TssN family type VI secretion system protein [Sabulibacter ruber]